MKSAITLIFAMMLALTACTVAPGTTPNTDKNTPQTEDVIRFSSDAEIIDFLKLNQVSERQNSLIRTAVFEESVEFAADSAAPTANLGAGEVASYKADDFSTTNVQVQGVDEADIVKNDGKYIYTLTNEYLTITDAYPAENAKLIFKEKIVENPRQMFLNNDELIIIAEEYEPSVYFSKYSIIPYSRSSPVTKVYLIDISDKEDLEVKAEYQVEGNYLQARMVDNKIVFVAQKSVYYHDDIVELPRISSPQGRIATDVITFPHPQSNYLFSTVAIIDLNSEEIEGETYMLGYSTNMYMSENNLYLTYTKQYDRFTREDFDKICFNEAVKELNLPASIKSQITNNPDWNEVNDVLSAYYDTLSEEEQEAFWDESYDVLNNCEEKYAKERQKTVVQKINIENGVNYVATGEVSGTPLNQFSMDESGDRFRIATNLNVWTRGSSVRNNNVYVMDEDLAIVGSLEGIADDERIYSTRFIGDRLYMVTFKTIDPFFVIDLSSDDPEILGELKIPGFSNYLHPYDENHIIGVGRETEGNEWGGTSTSGIKISLFDVTDVNNPKQVDKYEIGDRYVRSSALDDHKAFLFDKEKNILVIPITERKGTVRYYYDSNGQTWRGAYVLGLTPEEGFSLKGKVTHKAFDAGYYYYNNVYDVQRSLYMDDVLYTVSGNKIIASDLDTVTRIKTIDFDIEEEKEYPVYYID